jgi:hypothetical protein
LRIPEEKERGDRQGDEESIEEKVKGLLDAHVVGQLPNKGGRACEKEAERERLQGKNGYGEICSI